MKNILNKSISHLFYGGFSIGFIITAKVCGIKRSDIRELIEDLDMKNDRHTSESMTEAILETYDNIMKAK